MKKEIESFNRVPELPSLIELDELELEQVGGGDCGANCGVNCGTFASPELPVLA